MAWLSGWSYRQKITINSNGISLSGNLSNKQIEVRITSSNADFWASVKSDGGDVRFTSSDGITTLKKATIKFDSTGDDALYKLKVTTLDSVTDTEVYVYYGNASATTDDDTANTLESDTQALWPLDLNHADGAFADIASTNDGTNTDTTDAAGQVGRGRDFSGTAQYITCGTGMGLPGSRTIVASINGVHGAAALHAVVSKFGLSADLQDFYLAVYQQKIRGLITLDAGGGTYPAKTTNGATTLSDSTTYVIGMSWDNADANNDIKIWLNGADDSGTTGNAGTPVTTAVSSAQSVMLGARLAGASGLYDGVIDEVAVYNTVKSADWWKAEYQSRLGTWLSFGAQQDSIDVDDTGTGTDAIFLVSKDVDVTDTGTGTDNISLPIPKDDTGTGADAISIGVYIVIAEAPTCTEGLSNDKRIIIADTGAASDAVDKWQGTRYIVTDIAAGADTPDVRVSLSIADTGSGLDAFDIDNEAVLLLVVTNFPSGQTVQYRIEDGDGNLLVDWTSSGVQEYARGDGRSRYRVWYPKITNGVVDWRISGTTYYASEPFNVYSALADGVGYTESRAAKMDYLDASVLAIKNKTDNLPQGVQKNVALNNFTFSLWSSADGKSAATGLIITATRSIDGGAFGACVNTAVEIGSGAYKIDLAASDLNGDVVTLLFTAPGAIDRVITILTQS